MKKLIVLLALVSASTAASTLPQYSGENLNELSRNIDNAIIEVCDSYPEGEARNLYCNISRKILIKRFVDLCIETNNMSSSGKCKNISVSEYKEWVESKSEKLFKPKF